MAFHMIIVCRQKKTAFANGFEVHEVATGPHPKAAIAVPGKRVSVRYTGTLQSTGKVFDKTKGNKPFCFRLGALPLPRVRVLEPRDSVMGPG
jgi:FKBP-type peptidyl-prolyl cis-trans isomerase